ncbi:MAG: ABC transporter substrate-binding protein [Acidimicrobiales bacterium]
MRLPAGRVRFACLAVGLALVASSCGNAPPSDFSGAAAPGVTSTSISVGGIAAVTGPLGNQYSPALDGARAYFNMVNAEGGVDGRRIKVATDLDDQTDPATDIDQARALVTQDKVFAVVPVASPEFSAGPYLAAQGVPTFGYDINPTAQWAGPTMFGQDGSFIDPSGIDVSGPFLAKQLGKSRIAVLSYSVPQSAQCAAGQAASFGRFGFDVAVMDSSLPIGVFDLSADIARISAAHVGLVVMCMDPTGNSAVSQALHRAGLGGVAQYWLNGYDQASLASSSSPYAGVYLSPGYVPFEEASSSPGLQSYLAQMQRYFPKVAISEASLAGWISAAMFVKGLQLAGPVLTRARLVAAVNSLTDFTADGIEPPVDWHQAHTGPGTYNCNAWVRARVTSGGKGSFVPVFHQPFVCIRNDASTLAQLTNQPGAG